MRPMHTIVYKERCFNTAPQGHFMKSMTFTGCEAQRNKPVKGI